MTRPNTEDSKDDDVPKLDSNLTLNVVNKKVNKSVAELLTGAINQISKIRV